MHKLDKTDIQILSFLQQDSKLTNKEIAAQLNLTTTPVYERIKRMERENIIEKYVALINPDKVGLQLTAFCDISLKEHSREFIEKFELEISAFSEVSECYHIAGMFDYLLKVFVTDMSAYQNFIINKLATLENIAKVKSSFVMTTVKRSTAIEVK
ncbi:MAG: Lrp/AsnC family leucine-responsive transcriptional regulator [Cognaticolwellia sp.]|jgi:Lrp/AsnC family leucine-responsive transcriptional regulator